MCRFLCPLLFVPSVWWFICQIDSRHTADMFSLKEKRESCKRNPTWYWYWNMALVVLSKQWEQLWMIWWHGGCEMDCQSWIWRYRSLERSPGETEISNLMLCVLEIRIHGVSISKNQYDNQILESNLRASKPMIDFAIFRLLLPRIPCAPWR